MTKMYWNESDRRASLQEGWDLFNDDGLMRIQRVDDPNGVRADFKFNKPIPYFCNDDSAQQWVKDKARANKKNERYKRALRLQGEDVKYVGYAFDLMYTLSIKRCARCHKNHNSLNFTMLTFSFEDDLGYTHWAKCPTNGEPILMKVGNK